MDYIEESNVLDLPIYFVVNTDMKVVHVYYG